MRGQLNDFVSEGFLTYEVDGTTGPQLKLYRRCMDQNYHKHNWLAFLDLDEILVLRERYGDAHVAHLLYVCPEYEYPSLGMQHAHAASNRLQMQCTTAHSAHARRLALRSTN